MCAEGPLEYANLEIGDSIVIASPDYPDIYPPYENCEVVIDVRRRKSNMLTHLQLELAMNLTLVSTWHLYCPGGSSTFYNRRVFKE